MEKNTYLEVDFRIRREDREAAASMYENCREPFLRTVEGAVSSRQQVHDRGLQILHGFDTAAHAQAFLDTSLYSDIVIRSLLFWSVAPQVRM